MIVRPNLGAATRELVRCDVRIKLVSSHFNVTNDEWNAIAIFHLNVKNRSNSLLRLAVILLRMKNHQPWVLLARDESLCSIYDSANLLTIELLDLFVGPIVN